MNKLTRRWTLLLVCSLLAGCASTSVLLTPDSLYPDALTRCQDEPTVPARPAPGVPRTDAAKADYLVGVRDAGADCRDTVAATAARKKAYEEQYKKSLPFWKRITS